jgi:hypothetical protein
LVLQSTLVLLLPQDTPWGPDQGCWTLLLLQQTLPTLLLLAAMLNPAAQLADGRRSESRNFGVDLVHV